MPQWMGIINLTPDSFFAPSRAGSEGGFLRMLEEFVSAGASYIDLGAVSTRPGADPVDAREEWERLEPALRLLASDNPSDWRGKGIQISIDTTSAEIVRRAFELLGPFTVNDISSGEDDPAMLPLVGELGLSYIAMHKRGGPRTMDALTAYPDGIIPELLRYFGDFGRRAAETGISDWILDPGLGFAKTEAQNWEILERLQELKVLGRPILIGAADKRFTRSVPESVAACFPRGLSGTEIANHLAAQGGADILRVHRIHI